MRRFTRTKLRGTASAVLAATALLAGCGGGSGESEHGLRDGVYEFELTEEYLRANGISRQTRDESGVPR